MVKYQTESGRWLAMAKRQKEDAQRLANKDPALARDRMFEAIGSATIAGKVAAERVFLDTGDLRLALEKAAEILQRFAESL